MTVAVPERSAAEAPATLAPREDRATILIVDDSPVDARLAAAILTKRLGLQVAYAIDGLQALAMIARDQPLLVLTDLIMPHMDGLELVHEIKQRYPHLPVMLMTARGSEQVALEALKTGAASYVPKSVLQEELAAATERVLLVAQVDRRRQRFLESIQHLECRWGLANDET